MAYKIGIGVEVDTGAARGALQGLADFAQNALGKLGGGLGGKLAPLDLNRLGFGALQKGLKDTNQLGTSLSKIRFVDGRQFADANRQLLELQRNLERFGRTARGRDLNRRLKLFDQNADDPFSWDWEKMYHGDKRAAQRAREAFWGQAMHGKAPDPVAANEPIFGRHPRGEPPHERGLLRRATGWAWNTGTQVLGTATGLAGIGSLVGGIVTAYREHLSVLQSAEAVYKKTFSGQTFDEVEQNLRGLGAQLQLSAGEAGKLATSFAEASGRIDDSSELALGAATFGRGYGVDPNATAQQFGRAALVGYGADKGAQREFAALIAHTIADSGMQARSEQVMQDLVGHISDIADKEGRTAAAGEVGAFADFMAGLYRDNPALRGGGAQNILQGLSRFGAGGDVQQEAMAWAAYASGGGRSFIDFAKFKDADIFDDVGGGQTKLERLVNILQKSAGLIPGSADWEDKMAFVLKSQTGMSMQLGRAALGTMQKVGHMPGGFGGFRQWAEEATGKSLSDINPEAFANLSNLYGGSATDYRTVAEQYVSGYDKLNDNEKSRAKISQAQRDQLDKLLTSGDDAGLKALLPGLVATAGAANNPAEAARAATADLTNTLERTIGPLMGDLVRWLTTTGTTTLGNVADGLKNLSDTHLPALIKAVDALTGAILPILEKLGLVTPAQAAVLRGGPEPETDPAYNPATSWERLPGESDADWQTRQRTLRAGGNPRSRHAQEALRFLQDKGLGKEDSAAMVGNLMQESFPSLETGQHQNGAFGIASWRGVRRKNLEKWAAQHGQRSDDFKTQLEFLWWELSVDKANSQNALEDVKSASGIDRKARALRRAYFRPGAAEAHDAERERYARDMLEGRGAFDYLPADTGGPDARDLPGAKPTADDRFLSQRLGKGKTAASVTGLRDDFAASLAKLIAAAPAELQDDIHITSGYRDNQRQARLFREAVRKYGSEAAARRYVAPPGRSRHNHGLAADLATSPAAEKWLHEHAQDFGLHYPMPWEPWHIEPMGARSRRARAGVPAPSDISRLPIPPVPETPAPKTPEKLEKVSQSLSQQSPANARLDGQVEMALILQNERGQELHRRTGLLKSEPMIHGSGGSNNFTNRFIWNDTSVVA